MWIGLTLVHDVFLKTLSAYIANWWAEVASCPEMVFFPIELSEIAVIRFPHIICRDLLQGMNYVRNTVSRRCWNKKVHMVFIRFHVFYLPFALNVLCSPEWHEQVILYRRQDFPSVFVWLSKQKINPNQMEGFPLYTNKSPSWKFGFHRLIELCI